MSAESNYYRVSPRLLPTVSEKFPVPVVTYPSLKLCRACSDGDNRIQIEEEADSVWQVVDCELPKLKPHNVFDTIDAGRSDFKMEYDNSCEVESRRVFLSLHEIRITTPYKVHNIMYIADLRRYCVVRGGPIPERYRKVFVNSPEYEIKLGEFSALELEYRNSVIKAAKEAAKTNDGSQIRVAQSDSVPTRRLRESHRAQSIVQIPSRHKKRREKSRSTFMRTISRLIPGMH
jgi:hypothetical protein